MLQFISQKNRFLSSWDFPLVSLSSLPKLHTVDTMVKFLNYGKVECVPRCSRCKIYWLVIYFRSNFFANPNIACSIPATTTEASRFRFLSCTGNHYTTRASGNPFGLCGCGNRIDSLNYVSTAVRWKTLVLFLLHISILHISFLFFGKSFY